MLWIHVLFIWILIGLNYSIVSTTQRAVFHTGIGPQVSSKLITLPALRSHLQNLQDIAYANSHRNRALCPGCVGLNKSMDYVQDQLFPFANYYTRIDNLWVHWPGTNRSTDFRYSDSAVKNAIKIPLHNLETASWSRSANISGTILPVRNFGCFIADYPPETRGQIAYAKAGGCPQYNRSMAAGAAGVAALVTYTHQTALYREARYGGKRTPYPGTIPVQTVGVNGKYAVALSKAIETQTVNVTLGVFNPGVPDDRVYTKNLCYETKYGDPNKVIILGAHIDSVADGPGINDNGSGVAALLEIAKQLVNFSVVNKIKFCFWSGEEKGLLGSTFFVDHLSEEEKSKISIYLNFDMVGGLNPSFGVMNGSQTGSVGTPPAGSAAITRIWRDYFSDLAIPVTFYPFEGHTDHTAFKEAGIPIGAMNTGGMGMKDAGDVVKYGGKVGDPRDSYYHTANDTIDHVDMNALLIETKAIAHAVAVLGVDVSTVEKLRRDRTKRKRGRK